MNLQEKELYKWKPIDIKKDQNTPKQRWGHRLIHLNQQFILMYGGFGGSQSLGKYLDDLWAFNYTTNQWNLVETFGQRPEPRSNYTLHYDQIHNQVIMFGGASEGKARFNSIYILNWSSKLWRRLALGETRAIPWERTYHSSELIYPYLVVFGGQSCNNIDLNDLWAFNLQKNEWKQITFKSQSKFPDPRRFQSSAFLNGYLYIIGGCSGIQYTKFGDIYRVNLQRLINFQIYDQFEWQCVLTANKYLQRWGHSSQVFKGQIYISFGRVSLVQDSYDTFVFDPQSKSLQKMAIDNSHRPQPRRRHGSTLVGSALVVFGGYNGKYLSQFEYLMLKPTKNAKERRIQCILKDSCSQVKRQLSIFFQNEARELCFKAISASEIEIVPETRLKNLSENKYFRNLIQYSRGNVLKLVLPQFTELMHLQIILMVVSAKKLCLSNKLSPQFLQKLILTADYYCVPQLLLFVQDILLNQINDKNYEKIYSISQNYGLPNLTFQCTEKLINKKYCNLGKLIDLNKSIQLPAIYHEPKQQSSRQLDMKGKQNYQKSLHLTFQLIKFDLFQTKIQQSNRSILVTLVAKIKNFFKCQEQHNQTQSLNDQSLEDSFLKYVSEIPNHKSVLQYDNRYFCFSYYFRIIISTVMCIPQVRPSTSKAQQYVFVLKLFLVCQLIVASLNLAIDSYFVKLGVFGLFLSFCLFLSFRMLYYNFLLINVAIGIYFSCEYLFQFLVYFQNKTDIVNATSSQKFTFSVIIISLLFYFVSSIFYYFPYIQFKTIQYKENPGLAHIFELRSASQASSSPQQVPYEVNYGQITITEGKKNNDNGIFEISRGNGVKI